MSFHIRFPVALTSLPSYSSSSNRTWTDKPVTAAPEINTYGQITGNALCESPLALLEALRLTQSSKTTAQELLNALSVSQDSTIQ